MSSTSSGGSSSGGSGSPAREKLGDHVGAVKDDLHQLKTDFSGLAHAGVDTAKEQVQKVKDAAENGTHKAEEWHSALVKNVKQHPTAAVLASVAVGIMIGRMLGGR
jgi:ElaB/YqjD/DUF883 family membrane-anchored ribosome-binding protein